MSIWILINKDTCCEQLSLDKIRNQFDELNYKDYKIIKQEDIVYKISQEGLDTFINNEKIIEYPKIIYCRIHSGTLKPDLQIPLFRHFELLGVRIVNSIDAILKTTNKIWHFLELAKYNIPIPTTFTYCNEQIEPYKDPENSLEYPIIAKSVRGNRGNKVFMIPNKIAHDEMLGVLEHNVPYLYQDYIKESHGRDLRIIVINGKAIFSMIRQSNNGSVRANLSQGGDGTDVTGIYLEAENLAVKIAKILNIEICGVDLLFKENNEYVCCEVNNTPGFSKEIYDKVKIEKYICEYLLYLLNF